MKGRDEMVKRWQSGATIYLINELESSALKWLPDGKWYCKFHGQKEYQISEYSNMATIAFLGSDEISQQEYENY